jgi:hypothetical protein
MFCNVSGGSTRDFASPDGSDDPEYDASRLIPDHKDDVSDKGGLLVASGNGRSAADVGGTIPVLGVARRSDGKTPGGKAVEEDEGPISTVADGTRPDLAKPKRDDFLVNASSDATGDVERSATQSAPELCALSKGLNDPA